MKQENYMKFRHIGLVVKDHKKSLNFWTNNFGFKIASNKLEKGQQISKVLGIKGSVIRSVKLVDKTNRLFLELISFKNPKIKKKKIEVNSVGLTHFALTVKNLDQIYTKLNKKIKFTSKPILSVDKKVKVVYARVDDSLFIELVEELK